MKPNAALDRSVLLAELEAEQRRNEGIIFSAVVHVVLLLVAINFHSIEKILNLSSVNKFGNTSEKVEISLIEIGAVPGGTGVVQSAPQIENEASNVAAAPDIEKLADQAAVKNTQAVPSEVKLSQAQPAAVKLTVDEQADVSQKTKKEADTAAVTQAQIDLKRIRERQEKIQREIDESMKARQQQARAEEVANKEIANLVDEENDDRSDVKSNSRAPTDNGATGQSGIAFMDPETFNQLKSQYAKGAPQTGSSQFVVDIKQLSKNNVGQVPCPESRTYHNPADQCRQYTEKLYEPLCMYEYNECLELMKKYQMKVSETEAVDEN